MPAYRKKTDVKKVYENKVLRSGEGKVHACMSHMNKVTREP
jgi:hypothetical protein